MHGNQGMGLKIAGPTRHKKGLLIRSLKDGEATMLQIGWNGEEYGLIPIGPDGELISSRARGDVSPVRRGQGLRHRRDLPRQRRS